MKWPTLQGRLNQPIASRCDALKQMKANGDVLSPLAERYLEKHDKERICVDTTSSFQATHRHQKH
jgi:hypothetical protein